MTRPAKGPRIQLEGRAADSRAWWRGALTLPAVFVSLASASAVHWPDGPFIGPLARMLESAPFHLAVVGLVFASVLIWLGARRLAVALIVLQAIGLAAVVRFHVEHSAKLAPEAPTELSVLWFNMLHSNAVPPETLAQALIASDAEVIVLTEADPMDKVRALLQQNFAQVKGCTGRRCQIMVLARDNDLSVELQSLDPLRNEAMVRITNGGVTLVGVHLVKPWFYGISESDEWYAVHQTAQTKGPLVMVGDFNAAPWSARLRRLQDKCDLKSVRVPVPTWPSDLGMFGIPIDLTLTRDGAQITRLEPWGEGMGSNHRGLRFDIGLGGTFELAERKACRVPQRDRKRLGLD